MQCRICFETDDPHDMVSPCICAGSIAHIHRACLHAEQRYRREEWIRTGRLHCTICHTYYDPEYLEQTPKSSLPEIVMSSFIQICLMVCYVADASEDTTMKAAVVMCLIVNAGASFAWARLPMKHSLLQHLLVHITSLLLLARQAFPVLPWKDVPVMTASCVILYYILTVVERARQDQVESFPLFFMWTLVALEYLFVILAFHTSARTLNVSMIFTMAFTNLCAWGYSATRVYAVPH